MSKTTPIKEIININQLKDFFVEKNEYRNFALITLGLNTALRISDILNLRWNDIYDFKQERYYKHINITEKKTKKTTTILLNNITIEALNIYKHSICEISPEQFLMKSRNGYNKAITRNRAYIIIKSAANKLGLDGNISCHSLRKTFGYQAWKQGVPPALLMSIYNHSSIEITKIYLSIDQDDKDCVFYNLNL